MFRCICLGIIVGLVALAAPGVPALETMADYGWTITPDSSPTTPLFRPFVISRHQPVPGAAGYLFERVEDAGGQVVVDDPYDTLPIWVTGTETIFNYWTWWPTLPTERYIRLSAWSDRPEDGGVRLTEYDTAAVQTIHYDSRFNRMNFDLDVRCGDEVEPDLPAWECQVSAVAVPDDPTPGCDGGDTDRCWDLALLKSISKQREFFTWRRAVLAHDDKDTPGDCSDDTFTFNTDPVIKSGWGHTVDPRWRFSIARDGVTFVGLYGAWSGSYGFTQRPTLETGLRTSSAPIADGQWVPIAVVVGDAGSHQPALDCIQQMTPRVPGQALVKNLPPIPGGARLTPLKHSVTLFDGGTIYLPLDGINPETIEVELPEGIHLVDREFNVSPNTQGEYTATIVPDPPDGPLEAGYHRFSLERVGSQWQYLNSHVPLYVIFDPAQRQQVLAGGPYALHIRPRFDGVDCPQSEPTDCWQSIEIQPVATPTVPLPKRLHTNITWANTREWVTLPEEHPLHDPTVGFFQTYRRLGFNSIPLLGANAYDPDYPMFTHPDDDYPQILYTPAERTGPDWQGMTYGVQHSPLSRGFYDSGAPNPPGNPPWWIPGVHELLKWGNDPTYNQPCAPYSGATLFEQYQACVADKIDEHLDAEDRTQEEIDAWARALVFHDETKYYDMGYEGALLDRDLGLLGESVAYTRPDYLHLDAEFFPWFTSQWTGIVDQSQNAELRRQPGETDDELAYRMVDEYWQRVMQAIQGASPSTRVSLYDATVRFDSGYQAFPWEVLEAWDVIPSVSLYTLATTPKYLVEHMRLDRGGLPATYSDGTGPWELQPWITVGTPSERPSEEAFTTVVQSLLNGATGFNYFSPSWDIDELDDWLKISEGIRMLSWEPTEYATALDDATYPAGINGEDVVMDGTLDYESISGVGTEPGSGRENVVVGAMELADLRLIAVTPEPRVADATPPVVFNVALGTAGHPYELEDLRDQDPAWNLSVVGTTATISHPGLARSTVLRLALVNQPPEAQNVAIVPSGPQPDNDLSADYDYADADGDDENTALRRVRWFRDEAHQPLLDDLLTVPASETAEGQSWRFEIEVSDGRAFGPPAASAAETIVCTPPPDLTYLPTMALTPGGDAVLYVTDGSAELALYDLYRSPSPAGGFTKVATAVGDMDPALPGIQIIDSTGAIGGSFYYRILPHFAGCP